jgi:ABC-type nickel/cobalt efflux system permease component RcnA
MSFGPELLLVGAVAAVGVLHTMVPDHWAPIALIARQRSWTRAETARAAAVAGTGHVLSTLLIAGIVWLAGVAFAERFGRYVDAASSVALVAFGGWIAVSAWRELHAPHGHEHGHAHAHAHDDPAHEHRHEHEHDGEEPARDPLYAPLRSEMAVLTRHVHVHRHGRGAAHRHWHDHTVETLHALGFDTEAEPPLHRHRHKTTARTGLLLILGSSPMVEGIPAFFAAGKYGIGLIAVMAVVFALSTIATYVVLCVASAAGLQRLSLGSLERYGEVLSGAFIALVGVAFWLWPVL